MCMCVYIAGRFSVQNVDGRPLERQLRPELQTAEEMGNAFEVRENVPICAALQ